MPPLCETTRAKTHVFLPVGSNPGHDDTCPKNLSGVTTSQGGESSALFRNIAMHKRRFFQAHSSSCSRNAMDYTFRRLNLERWR